MFRCQGLNTRLLTLSGQAAALQDFPSLVSEDKGVFKALCCCHYLAAQPCPILCDPMNCSPPGSSAHGVFPGKNTGVGCHLLLLEIFLTPGVKPLSPVSAAWQADFLS